jgi:hypothetical protein
MFNPAPEPTLQELHDEAERLAYEDGKRIEAKLRAFSGTGDWSLDESDPDVATVVCSYCKHALHFSPTISRVSIELEMQKHRAMYCHGEKS